MKKRKGFTLVELLAVIVILGILLSITTIAVNNIKKQQDKKNYVNVISSILTGAKQYATDNTGSYTSKKVDGTYGSIEVQYLLNAGVVDFDQEKYSTLTSSEVKIYSCGSDSLKRKFQVIIDGKTYNDCGCAPQVYGTNSTQLCED